MSENRTLLVLSDIHYASAAEKAQGFPECQVIRNPLLRLAVKAWQRFIWRRDHFAHNHRLDEFLQAAGNPDYVIAVGDYSCDSRFVGVSDPAACASAHECLTRLRRQFGPRFHAILGDHELGKMSLVGGVGGMRLASWQRAQSELELQRFWQVECGNYRLMGVASSLVALPVYEPETLVVERPEWQRLRTAHLVEIRQAFAALRPEHRVLLFCHDPTALPFLWQDDIIRQHVNQLVQTFVGHLHSNLIYWTSQLLAGMPAIHFLGNSIRRMSSALHEARHWKPFKVRLCPALAGIELLNDGGFYTVVLDPTAQVPAQYHRQRMGRY